MPIVLKLKNCRIWMLASHRNPNSVKKVKLGPGFFSLANGLGEREHRRPSITVRPEPVPHRLCPERKRDSRARRIIGLQLDHAAPASKNVIGASTEVDRIEVRWPNGNREVFPGGSADRFVAVIEGQGQNPGNAHSSEARH